MFKQFDTFHKLQGMNFKLKQNASLYLFSCPCNQNQKKKKKSIRSFCLTLYFNFLSKKITNPSSKVELVRRPRPDVFDLERKT